MKKIEVVRIYQRKQALVVDDFPDMRISLKTMLKNMGCETIDTACNGKEAISLCENRDYDIVLCDYNLGSGKTGQQILENVRFHGLLKNTALYLMITAETSREMVHGALEYLPDDYLTKPFTQASLESRLNRLVIEKELLRAIYSAMDKKDYDQAVALCKREIEQQSRFKQKCLRILAWCLFSLEEYDESKCVYETILGERELDWAQIGLGKCLLSAGQLNEAEQHFQSLLDQSKNNTEALDLMSEVQSKKGDRVYAQQLLQKAADISPNVILRQKALAKVCDQNGDWESAKTAYGQTIKLGQHSCHEKSSDYFDYAHCISTQLKNSTKKDNKLINEAEAVLSKAKKKYRGDDDIKLQSDLINAGLYKSADQEEEFQSRKEDLITRMESCRNPPPDLALEMAQSYQSMDMKTESNDILIKLAKRFEDNDDISEMIDKISDEPITKKGKQQAGNLNQQAKALFDKKDFRSAIKLIDEAIYIFPNNKALNVNLLTALIKQMQDDVASNQWINKCDEVISRVGNLDEDDLQFDRYHQLCKQVDTLRGSL